MTLIFRPLYKLSLFRCLVIIDVRISLIRLGKVISSMCILVSYQPLLINVQLYFITRGTITSSNTISNLY